MVVFRRKFVTIAECWDGEQPQASRADIIRYFQQTEPREGMRCRDFYTILLNLSQPSDALLSGMKRDTRYEIRRAAKDSLVYHWSNGKIGASFEEFCDYYDAFASEIGQPKQNRYWLSLLAGDGVLGMSAVKENTGEALVWHAYHRSKTRATLLYSASLFRHQSSSAERNRIGRANRFHHWRDMLQFKSEGLSIYDFGGWYEGNKDEQRLRINKFKEEFGGEIVRNYICEQPLTARGKLFLWTRQMLLGNAI